MGFFNLLKRSEVPKELPNLALDELKNKNQADIKSPENEFSKKDIKSDIGKFPLEESLKAESFKPLPIQPNIQKFHENNKQELQIKEDIKRNMGSPKNEKSFFKDMLENIDEDAKNLEQLENWYEKKIEGVDVVSQMKEYWEQNRPELILKNIGSELKVKVKDKTEHLHTLEQQWQEMYMNLLTKEEEIRDEEKTLKKMIAEFVSICEKHLPKKKKPVRK